LNFNASATILTVFVLLYLTPAASCLDENEGVPFPSPLEGYFQPVPKKCSIISDNTSLYRKDEPGCCFGWNYDIGVGIPVVAARSGVVLRVRNDSIIGGTNHSRYLNEANYVIIDHLDGWCTKYIHLAKIPDPPRRGEYVLKGELIGISGNTGYAPKTSLLYTVISRKTAKSSLSFFSDFKKNNGVPMRGDKTPKSHPPATPQKETDKYKICWRACCKAEKLGFPAIAWTFATSISGVMKHEEYFYHQVLVKKAEKYKNYITKRLSYLKDVPAPEPEDVFEGLLLMKLLEKTNDPILKEGVRLLFEKLNSWNSAEAESLKVQTTILGKWIRGLKADCLGDYKSAAEAYEYINARGAYPCNRMASKELKRIIDEMRKELRTIFGRLEYEYAAGNDGHRKSIAKDAKTEWKRYSYFLDLWASAFPDEKEKAIELLKEEEVFFIKLTKK